MAYLDEMIGRRRKTVKSFVAGFSGEQLQKRLQKSGAPKNVLQALSAGDDVCVIAGFVRRAPGAGDLAPYMDAGEFAADSADAGAGMLCCMCEPEDFGGDFDDVAQMRDAVGLPIIARDFAVTSEQLAIFRAFGADACVIVAGQVGDKLASFLKLAVPMGLTPVVEVKSARELDFAISQGAPVVLVDTRDAQSGEGDRELALEVVSCAWESGVLAIAAGFISNREDVEAAAAAGACAVLADESLMLAADAAELLGSFAGVPRRKRPQRTSLEVRGVRTPEQGVAAARAGADAVAVCMAASDPAHISAQEAAQVFNSLPSNIRRIGVFDAEGIEQIHEAMHVSGLDAIEYRGDASPLEIAQFGRPVIKAVLPQGDALPLESMSDYGEPVVSFLVDAAPVGGWAALAPLPAGVSFIVGGGLTAQSAGDVIAGLRPAAVVCDIGVASVGGGESGDGAGVAGASSAVESGSGAEGAGGGAITPERVYELVSGFSAAIAAADAKVNAR